MDRYSVYLTTCSNNWIVGEGHCHIQLTIYIHSLKFISYKVINSSGMTMLTSWKLDPYTVMRLNSGRRGDDVLKGGHLACSSHKPLTSSYSPVTKRLQAGQDKDFRIVYPAKYDFYVYWAQCCVLRDSTDRLNVPLRKTNYLKRSFSYRGVTLWNCLHCNLREEKSPNGFKQLLNFHFS